MLRLALLQIPKRLHGQGRGTRAMKLLCHYADEHGLRVELTPNRKDKLAGTTSRARLFRFYKRFGFVENKGQHRDYETRELMYRKPADR